MIQQSSFLKGRGAQINSDNKYSKHSYVAEHIEGIDEAALEESPKTEFFFETPKNIVNKIESPDLAGMYSMNPYQGCEHGCLYCYARNSHQYWGFSGGLDFEQKIVVKKNAAALLKKLFDSPKWQPHPIMLAGNTDCYQPAERKFGITRNLLEVFLEYGNPVSVITKNSLILRDIDLLAELAAKDLTHVNITITSLNEDLRQKLEPRTVSYKNRLKTVEELSKRNIPVNIMVAPIIPSFNDHEIPAIIEQAADHGARSAAYTIVRLNGMIKEVFEDWIHKSFPDRAEKVLRQIAACHGGKVNDSRFGTRMRGEGKIAEIIKDLFLMAKQKHMSGREIKPYALHHFRRPGNGQLNIF